MIITRQKDLQEMLALIGSGPVFLVGCSECATLCGTGGKDQVDELAAILASKKIPVTGSVVLEPACHLLNSKRLLKNHEAAVQKAQTLLVLACGNGVQTVAELFPEKSVIGGTHALFIGEVVRAGEFEKRCTLCGDCVLEAYGGLCPVARCPKSLLNGPCGGVVKGKCEISPEMPCVWDQIYTLLKRRNQLQLLKTMQSPKDWSKAREVKVSREH